jgi:thiol-disulfide isomerase/thioredoxin
MLKISFLLVIILNATTSAAQDTSLFSIIELRNFHQLSQLIIGGELEFQVKNKGFNRTDTTTFIVQQVFSKPKDLSSENKFKFLIHHNNNFITYNGKKFLKESSTKSYFLAADWRKIYFDINLYNYIIPSYGQFIERIEKHLFNKYSTILKKDTLIDGRDVTMVLMVIPYPFMNDSFTTQYSATVYFSKENLIPIKWHSTTSHNSWGTFYTEMTLLKYNFSDTVNIFYEELINERIRQAEINNYEEKNISDSVIIKHLQLNERVPDVKLFDFHNRNIDIYPGEELTLYYFWYFRCYPCLLAQTDLIKLHENYESRGLKIIAINVTDSMNEVMQNHFTKSKIPYFLAAADRSVLKSFRVKAFPTFFLVKGGVVLYSRAGYSSDFYKGMEIEIERIVD